MTKLIYGLLSLLVIASIATVAIVIANNPAVKSGVAAAANSPLEIDRLEHDYKDIPIRGGKAITTFTLSNNSSETIAINKITTSCMCTEAIIDGKVFGMHGNPYAFIEIAPNSKKTMQIEFDPMAHGDVPEALGQVTRLVYVGTNSTVTPQLQLKLSGNVIK
jgi:hypothetical protein